MLPGDLMFLPVPGLSTSSSTQEPAWKGLLPSVCTSHVSIHSGSLYKSSLTEWARVELVLVLCVHHFNVLPQLGICVTTVGALFLPAMEMYSSLVYHHLQPTRELF